MPTGVLRKGQTGGNHSPIIASRAPGILKTRTAWVTPAIVVINEQEKIATRRIRSPDETRTPLRIQSGARTRIMSETVSAAGLISAQRELRPSETRLTNYLCDTDGISEDTLGKWTVFPCGIFLLANPEHLNDEEGPLKEE